MRRRAGRRDGPGIWAWMAVVLLGGIALFFMLGRLDIEASHEARVFQTAREMAATGWAWNSKGLDVPGVEFVRLPDGRKFFRTADDKPPMHVNPWIVPVMNDRIRLQKPPLPYWLDATLFRLIGFNELAARLPSAIFGLLSIFLIVDLGRRLFSPRAGLLAGLVWVSTYFVIASYRKTMADPDLGFFTLLCLWSWVAACRGNAEPESTIQESGAGSSLLNHYSAFFILLFYFSLAMGVLAKGPVILLHVIIAAGLFSWCYRRWPMARGWWHLGGAVLFLAISLAWPWHVVNRLPNAWHLWRYESVGEFTDNVEDARPWWFYLPNIFLIAAPWTIITVIGAADVIKRAMRRKPTDSHPWALSWRHPRVFPLAWFVLIVFAFSLSNLKKNMYLLPVMPAVALLTVQGIESMRGWLRLRRLRDPAVVIQIGMAAAAMAVSALATTAIIHDPLIVPGLLIAAGAFVFAVFAIIAALKLRLRAWVIWQSAATALAIGLLIGFYTSAKDNLRSPRPVIAAVQPMLDSGKVGIGLIDLPEEVSVYLPLKMPINPHANRQLLFTRSPRKKPQAYKDKFPGKQILSSTILHLPGISKSSPWSVVEVTTN